MTTEQKLIAYAISALLAAVLSIVTYNFYDSSVRVAAYRECFEANKVIADMLSDRKSDSLRVTSIQSCYMR